MQSARAHVLLMDADPQGSLRKWSNRAQENGHEVPSVLPIDGPRIPTEIEKFGPNYDFIVIDAPPHLGEASRVAMVKSNLVIIPVSPDIVDVEALEETLAVLQKARRANKNLRARIILNKADRTTLNTMAEKLLADQALVDLEVPLLDQRIRDRIEYRKAMLVGTGVTSFAAESDGAGEVRRLVKELDEVINGPN